MLFAGPAAAADVPKPDAIFYGVVGVGATPVSAVRPSCRDLLMNAGFGHDVNAHRTWMPE